MNSMDSNIATKSRVSRLIDYFRGSSVIYLGAVAIVVLGTINKGVDKS
jgi:hypothetical protein